MPTYEYTCKRCGENIEVFQSFSEKPLRKHQECGGELQKVFHARGVVFKGSGFYSTDSTVIHIVPRSPSRPRKPTPPRATPPRATLQEERVSDDRVVVRRLRVVRLPQIDLSGQFRSLTRYQTPKVTATTNTKISVDRTQWISATAVSSTFFLFFFVFLLVAHCHLLVRRLKEGWTPTRGRSVASDDARIVGPRTSLRPPTRRWLRRNLRTREALWTDPG